MEALNIGGIIVAIVAALGAWAAQRAAAKASKVNTKVSGRLEAERGAYERARKFDVETIERQAKELKHLTDANEALRRELVTVKERLRKLEDLIPEWERLLHEREEE